MVYQSEFRCEDLNEEQVKARRLLAEMNDYEEIARKGEFKPGGDYFPRCRELYIRLVGVCPEQRAAMRDGLAQIVSGVQTDIAKLLARLQKNGGLADLASSAEESICISA